MDTLIEKGLRLCKQIGGQTFIVGGAVRDMILGAPIKDVDIATNVSVEDICKKFKTHDIGKNKDFGIVVVQWEGEQFEVAHFRQDGQYVDNRHPETVKFVNDIKEDLARRDFTINAMAYDGDKIIDPFGGQADLAKGILRFVGNASERIREDGLRVLRAYRFAARYNLEMVDEHEMWKFDLSGVSQERITDEIRKVASYGGKPLAFFMHRTARNDIIVIDEIQNNRKPHQLRHHPEGNVFEHIISCLCQSSSQDYMVNLCVLFHDIGKIATYEDMDHGPTFYNHDVVGAQMMDEVGKRLKLSQSEIDTIKYVCEYHMIWWCLPNMKKTKMLNIALHDDAGILDQVCLCDEMSRLYLGNQHKFMSVAKVILMRLGSIKNKMEYDNKIKQFVDGTHIIGLTGKSGKDVGIIKKATIEYLTEKDFNATQDEIDLFIKDYNA